MAKVTIQGLAGFKADFISATKDITDIIDQELESMAKDWVVGAKRDAPKDLGGAGLEGGITYDKLGTANYLIASNAFYSHFMEFGTKGKYLAIPGTEAIAQQMKGYKGTGSIFLAIKKWVLRKGIGASLTKSGKPSKSVNSLAAQNSAAFLIARSILKNGVNPHPYFFKQQEIVWPKMVRIVKSRLDSKVTVIMPGEILRPNIITI